MFARLPDEIDPLRLADEGRALDGELSAGNFKRLSGVVGPVTVALRFERTAHGTRHLRGTIKAQVETTCQRCLETITLRLEATPDVELATSEPSAGAQDEADTLVVTGRWLLQEYVEDELLLVMPMIPAHTESPCRALPPGLEPTNTGRQPVAGLGRNQKQ